MREQSHFNFKCVMHSFGKISRLEKEICTGPEFDALLRKCNREKLNKLTCYE